MRNALLSRHSLALIVPLVFAVGLSGCALLGLGAAAVGGCALLDENEDDRVTQAEFSAGLFDSWDEDNDDSLSEAEFNDGVDRSDVYDDWSDDYGDWDSDGDESLTQAEFAAGIAAGSDREDWADRRCDELGL